MELEAGAALEGSQEEEADWPPKICSRKKEGGGGSADRRVRQPGAAGKQRPEAGGRWIEDREGGTDRGLG